MADPVVHITAGIPDSGTGNITTLGQTLLDGANVTLGANADAAVTTNASGSVSAKLRGIVTLLAGTLTVATHAVTQSGSWVLSAGAAIIGKVGIDQTTDGTTNAVRLLAETTKVIGVVRAADGSGNLLTSTGAALDVNLKSGLLSPGAAIAADSSPAVLATDQATLAVALDTSQIANGKSGVMLTPTKAKISVSTATTTTLVALQAGKKIRVLSLYLMCAAADTVTLQSHTTTSNSDGGLPYTANAGIVLPFNPVGWFDTTAGEALDMVTSAAGQVSGQLTYVAV